MQHELQAAVRIQRSLLPDGKFDRSELQIAWHYLPCDELAGDFLNYFMLDDKHVAFFVVDVTGHGTASALLAVTIGRVLTAQATATSLLVRQDPFTGRPVVTPPASVAAELNRRFPMEQQGDLSFTLVYGVLNLETLEMRYVNAGHPQIVHAPVHGEPVLLAGEGFGVGWLDDIEYDEYRVQLQPGDRLYFYSDGVPEALPRVDGAPREHRPRHGDRRRGALSRRRAVFQGRRVHSSGTVPPLRGQAERRRPPDRLLLLVGIAGQQVNPRHDAPVRSGLLAITGALSPPGARQPQQLPRACAAPASVRR